MTEHLVEAAKAFAPQIAAMADRIEQQRHVPQDLADAMAQAGLYHMCVPKAVGGEEAHPVTFLKVVEALAAADASTGWCVSIGATCGLVAAYIPEDAGKQMIGDRQQIGAGVFAPMGKAMREGDGYRANGRWNWGSGSANASWIMGGCMIMGDDGKPEMAGRVPNSRMMIVPIGQAEIHDTWDVMGLSGTGSNEFSITDTVVPAAHSVALATDQPWATGPLFAFPAFGLLATGIAAVSIGAAQGALDEFIALAGAKTPQYSKRSLAAKPIAQIDFGKAAGKVNSARAYLHDAVSGAFETACETGTLANDVRANVRLAATNAASECAEAVKLLYTAAGGTPVFRKTPLQRRFRDVHVATQHLMVSPSIWELTGRVMLGVETDTAML